MREKVRDGSELGSELSTIMNGGHLVPDELANDLVVETIAKAIAKDTYQGILLDGYPRTLNQAVFFDSSYVVPKNSTLKVVDIKLDDKVAIAKLLGRRICSVCSGSFNTAHIVTDGYDMPAILPNASTCKLESMCRQDLVKRDDDTEATIVTRLAQHKKNSLPILEYYKEKCALETFNVYKGVKDVDALIDLICAPK